MDGQMKEGKIRSHSEEKTFGAAREVNKKDWQTPQLVKIDTSTNTEYGPNVDYDGVLGYS